MPKLPGASTTRKKTEIFLLGQAESSLPSKGKLPITSDVMRYFFYRRNLQVKYSFLFCVLFSQDKVSGCQLL